MANKKILEQKQNTINEIKDKFENAASVVVFDYQGLSVSEVTELRRKLRDINAEFKVYKNTLTRRATDALKIDLNEHLVGANGISFSTDALGAIKVLSTFAKEHKALELKAGIVDGVISDKSVLAQYASIPDRQTLLTMLAAGMMGTVRDLAIGLDLYSKKLEN